MYPKDGYKGTKAQYEKEKEFVARSTYTSRIFDFANKHFGAKAEGRSL